MAEKQFYPNRYIFSPAENQRVVGAPVEDILTIVNLKRDWQYVMTQNEPLTLPVEKQINKVVAVENALVPGELRQGQGGVNLGNANVDFFEPLLINVHLLRMLVTA